MPASVTELVFTPQRTGLMSLRKTHFEQCLHNLAEDQGGNTKHDCFSLGVVCALEHADKLQAPVDFLELPVLEPVKVPTMSTLPTLPNSARRLPSLASLRRRHGLPSLATLRQQRAHAEVRQPGRPSDESHLNMQLYACLKNNEEMLQSTCQKLGTLMKINPPLLKTRVKTKESQMMTTNWSGRPSGNAAHELRFSRDAVSTIDPKLFLAGAASLGLRHMCNMAIIEPSGPEMGKTPQDEVCIDEGHAAMESQPQVQKTVRVPYAPCKPKPQGRGKRPQICGVPVLVIPPS